MFGMNNNNKSHVSKVDVFMQDVERFESSVLGGRIANEIVLAAIKDAQMNGVYATFTGLMKKYNERTNDGVWAGINN